MSFLRASDSFGLWFMLEGVVDGGGNYTLSPEAMTLQVSSSSETEFIFAIRPQHFQLEERSEIYGKLGVIMLAISLVLLGSMTFASAVTPSL